MTREDTWDPRFYQSGGYEGGDGEFFCPRCGQRMYYDGRCGDGPVCMTEQCRRIEAANAMWANR